MSTVEGPVQAQPAEDQGWNLRKIVTTVLRFWLGFVLISTVMNQFFPKTPSSMPASDDKIQITDKNGQPLTQTSTANQPPADNNPLAALLGLSGSYSGETSHIQPTFDEPEGRFSMLRNLWREDVKLHYELWLSPSPHVSHASLSRSQSTPEEPTLVTKAVHKNTVYQWDESVKWFGDEPYHNTETLNLFSLSPLYESHLLVQNKTLYAHVFIYPAFASPDEESGRYNEAHVVRLSDPILRHIFVPKNKQLKSLLGASQEAQSGVAGVGNGDRAVEEGGQNGQQNGENDSENGKNDQNSNTQLAPLSSSEPPTSSQDGTTITYLIPTLTTRILADWTVYGPEGVPAPLTPFFHIFPKLRGYTPPAYIDRFWELKSSLVRLFPPKAGQNGAVGKEIIDKNGKTKVLGANTGDFDDDGNNEAVKIAQEALWGGSKLLQNGQNGQNNQHSSKVLNFTVSFAPTSIIRWQLQRQIDLQWKQQESMGLATRTQNDTSKRMILETNPYLLAVTVLVSLLHSLFEFLAFKNDISHWKSMANSKGMSIRTLIYNAVSQTIIFLYLLDNDTSYIILISTGFNVLLEIWKITKARDIVLLPEWPFIKVSVKEMNGGKKKEEGKDEDDKEDKKKDKKDKKQQENTDKKGKTIEPDSSTDADGKDEDDEEEEEDRTDEYDAMAFKYLGLIMFPLLVCYSGYSLIYNEHKSWYSFFISTSVQYIYMFGFIPMTAQLFINYRLKSTAHIPAKVWMYKCLNTFIDDLFSFVIKMPWLHRLACLRDDVVFLVLLYQKWIYRVDYSRVNEYGQVFNDDGTQANTKEGKDNGQNDQNGQNGQNEAKEEQKTTKPLSKTLQSHQRARNVEVQDVQKATKSTQTESNDLSDIDQDTDSDLEEEFIGSSDEESVQNDEKAKKAQNDKNTQNDKSAQNAQNDKKSTQNTSKKSNLDSESLSTLTKRSDPRSLDLHQLPSGGTGASRLKIAPVVSKIEPISPFPPGSPNNPSSGAADMDLQKGLTGKGRWGDDDSCPPEEVPDWVMENQKKLLKMKAEEEAKMAADPVYAEMRRKERENDAFATRLKHGLIDKDGNELVPDRFKQPVGPQRGDQGAQRQSDQPNQSIFQTYQEQQQNQQNQQKQQNQQTKTNSSGKNDIDDMD